MASEWEMESCVRGYHIYQSVWTPTLDDELICVRDPFNSIDRYAVAVKSDDDSVVRHLPKRYQDSVLYFYGEEEALCASSLEGGGIHRILATST